MDFFKESEFACPCCGENKINPQLVTALEHVRQLYFGKPLIISSGYRCLKREKKVNGTGANHPKGWAADLMGEGHTPIEGEDLLNLIVGLYEQGIERFILYRDRKNKPHLHVDMNPDLEKGIHLL